MGTLKKMRRLRNQSYADPTQRAREDVRHASIWDMFDKIKLPAICGSQICPPGWTCKVEQSGSTSCVWSPPTALPGVMPAQFVQPGIDWSKYWSKTSDDYRGYVNLQVFAKGVGQYAGQPPSLAAVAAGLDAVFKFVMTTVPWPPPGGAKGEERMDAAAEAALEVANEVYESDVVAAALDLVLPKWTSTGAMGFAA